MAQFIGANVDELRELARFFDQHGQQLETIGSRITTSISKSTWVGGDQETFTSDWQSRLRPQITRASAALDAASRLLESNAREQELASGEAGGGGNPTFGRPSDDDLMGNDPLNPDSDDMGDDKPFTEEIYFDDVIIRYQKQDEDGVDRWDLNIQQGALGDCWFLSGAGAVALYDPQWIEDHARYNEDDNTYTVTFYKDGKPVEITVDASAPELAAKSNWGPSWITVYEKAAAVYYGGEYGDLDGGHSDWAFEAITGKPTQREGELNFSEIEERMEDGPVALGTERQDKVAWFFGDVVDDNRIVPQHVYMVGGFRENDGVKEILVVNPWGSDGGIEGDEGSPRLEEVWITEEEYKENFSTVYSVDMS